jgi:[ribosomal protein S5]-alanine N-acetyltransferase
VRRARSNPMDIETKRLTLVRQTRQDVLAQIERMDAAQRAQLSPAWLALVHSGVEDRWTLGFALVHRATRVTIGGCGFKGPPDGNEMVEIAYGVAPDHQGHGYATEAAEALVADAFSSGQVRVVRAHTFADSNASARVLAKCGFQPVGQVIDPEDGLVWRWERLQ